MFVCVCMQAPYFHQNSESNIHFPFVPTTLRPNAGHGLILEVSRSHRTLLDEWSARRGYFCLTAHYTHKRQTSMPPAGFEPTNPASERPQTHALRPRGYWDRRNFHFCAVFFVNLFSHQPIFNLPLDCDVNYIFSPSLVDVIASAAGIIS
jgi:hypothetical protein